MEVKVLVEASLKNMYSKIFLKIEAKILVECICTEICQ
jgi:hypothetical protein